MTRVAVVGVGRMGRPMAGHIVRGGHDVAVFDADPALAAEVAAAVGARALTAPEDFADRELVITMLPTSAIVAEALIGGGIAASLPAGALVVDMSSSNPAETLETARRLAERGVALVDAPVSGGVGGAVDGTLAIMLGGDDATVAPALPVLETMSRVIFRTGPVGSGHAMKALNNVVAGAATLAGFEALAAGRHYGLDERTMIDIWNHSTARSFVTENVMAHHVATHTFDSGFPLPLYAKDVGVADALVRAAGIDAPVVAEVARGFAAALAELGDVDHTRLWDLRAPEAAPADDAPADSEGDAR